MGLLVIIGYYVNASTSIHAELKRLTFFFDLSSEPYALETPGSSAYNSSNEALLALVLYGADESRLVPYKVLVEDVLDMTQSVNGREGHKEGKTWYKR